MDSRKQVSFLGIGLMGKQMCKHLIAKKYPLVAWNRTKDKAVELKQFLTSDNGLKIMETSNEAILASNLVILMLWDCASIKEVLGNLPANSLKNRTIINMSTISPDESKAFEKQLNEAEGTWIEAPVLGTWTVAEKAALQVMVGASDKSKFEEIFELLSCFGTPKYLGKAFSESYAFLEKSGADTETFVNIVSGGPLNMAGGYYPTWANKFKERNYSPIAFACEGIQKDIGLALEQFKAAGVHYGAAEGIYKHISDANKIPGVSDKDFSAVFEAALKPPHST